MSLINQTSTPPQGASVFNPMLFTFEWAEAAAEMLNVDGNAGLRINGAYADILPVGATLRLTNGAYLGSYQVTESVPLVGGLIIRLTIDTPFIGNSLATGTNRFIPEAPAEFEIISGYLEGPEAAIKPWAVTSTLRVSPDTAGVYRFDVSGFLKSQFTIDEPQQGPAVPISLRYLVRLKSDAALPTDEGALTAYYGLTNLTGPQRDGLEPIGDRPVLSFGGVPTLYSLAGAKGIIQNFIADPAAGLQTTAASTIDVQLLSCEPREILWLGASPAAGFTTDPALPDWIQATAEGDNIRVIINPCTGGVADYLAADYNPADYLTSGQLNSVTGCFSFAFELAGAPLFTLGVCVTPVAELVDVCPADSLIFAWLNTKGGYSSLAAEGRYIDGRTFGNETTVVTPARILKRVELRDVYDTTEISGGVISKAQLDLLADLRTSIQAYQFNPASQAFDIPIVIERESFRTYGNKFNQSETRFSFRFRKARQIQVQTQ